MRWSVVVVLDDMLLAETTSPFSLMVNLRYTVQLTFASMFSMFGSFNRTRPAPFPPEPIPPELAHFQILH